MRLVWLLTSLGLLGLSIYALDEPQTAVSRSLNSIQVDDAPSFQLADAINAPCLGVDRLHGEPHDLQPSQLDVEIPDVRGWNKNLFEAIVSPYDVIGDEYKADFDGFVTVKYSGLEESCRIPATIRISGDLKDHLAWKNFPSPVSSLDIKLRDESIDGIVRFKLFLPGTRQGRWEILQTEVMRAQGLPSPRTFQIATKVNGTDVSYLFQEKFAKEMVEKHKLRDSLLLEADEELRWQYGAYFAPEELIFAKVLNSNWVERGPSSTMIGWEGVTYLLRALSTTWHPLESLPDGTRVPNLMAPELLSPDTETTLTAGENSMP